MWGQRKVSLAHAASPVSGLSMRFRWLHGPAITEIRSPHLRGGCRLIASLHLREPVRWELGGHGPGNLLGKWESDWVFHGPALGRTSSLRRRPPACAMRSTVTSPEL